jgi:hypothetical protein
MAYLGIGNCEECGWNAEYDEVERMNNEEILDKLNATIAELKAELALLKNNNKRKQRNEKRYNKRRIA